MSFSRYLLPCLLTLGLPGAAAAFEPFVIEAIEVEGLQRISPGTVFNELSLQRGDLVDEMASDQAIRALFASGQFEDVVLERRGNTLIVFVAERPSISKIEIEGTEMIAADELRISLAQLGFTEGRVFNRSMLEKVEHDLRRQYLAQGKYGMRMEITVTPEQRNRVAVRIAVDEGDVATIRHINIVGNQAFSDDELLKQFELGPEPPFALMYSDDQYSKQRLLGDLERLRSYYLDRGYIRYEDASTQVSLSPDKRDVYITVNITEGLTYKVKQVRLAGRLLLPEEELMELIGIEPGSTYSRSAEQRGVMALTNRFGEDGYAAISANVQHEIDDETQEVSLTYHIDPGKRNYVRRINISGNHKTNDEVIRRELRQMEGGVQVPSRVQRSKMRLDRLGYFEQVQIEPVNDPLTNGSDLNVRLLERETFGSLNLGVGYDGANGLLIQTSVSQDNFLGSGKKFSVEFNNSDVNTVYSINYTNPYHTLDGVSRNLNAFFRSTDTSQLASVNYLTDAYGLGVRYGIPISEHDNVSLGIKYEKTLMHVTQPSATTTGSSQTILDFCTQSASIDDCTFSALKPYASWSHDTRNRAIFPNSGSVISASATVATPAGEGSLEFYTLRLSGKHLRPVIGPVTFAADLEIAYGDAYGSGTELPPFERYYAGGISSVRGYRSSSLGPRDALGQPIGGNARLIGSLELLFPPSLEESSSMRMSLFVDGGNVFDTHQADVDLGEVRYSAGIGLNWYTPVGPLLFSVARPMNAADSDETESFQFTIGSAF